MQSPTSRHSNKWCSDMLCTRCQITLKSCAYGNGSRRTAAQAAYEVVSFSIIHLGSDIEYLASAVRRVAGDDGGRCRTTKCRAPGCSSSSIAGHDHRGAAGLANGVTKRTGAGSDGECGDDNGDRWSQRVD